MKIYLLVEGDSTEMYVYPFWLNYFLPSINQYQDYEEFKSCDSGFHLFSGKGYPNILGEIQNASKNINDIGNVDHFFIILDSDEDKVEDRKKLVQSTVNTIKLPDRVNLHIIIQNRCFETALLANPKTMSRQPRNEPLISFVKYYNLIDNDPEKMGNFSKKFTHSQFHTTYANNALREKKIRYTKSNPRGICTKDFLEEILKRIDNTNHISSFKEFFDRLKNIKSKLELV
ncbi:MAG: oligoribonuclease NrnB/cAMP/cGMP phosphodiesterase (DHH superfamily) [Colwellia sp.]|jgi:oligoribonuclease NrnB/cAMP/cGMP phosphodiesterase (DHH superfamily)